MGARGPTTYISTTLKPRRQGDLRALADALESLTEDWGPDFSYFHAAQHLRELADGLPEQPPAPGWLEEACPARVAPVRACSGPEHGGPKNTGGVERVPATCKNSLPESRFWNLAAERRLPKNAGGIERSPAPCPRGAENAALHPA